MNYTNKKIRYAVITPVKNEEKYIGKVIDSIVNQTILPQVWIIINDGSTDRTEQILKTFETKYKWINVIHLNSNEKRKVGGAAVIHHGLNLLDLNSYEFIVRTDGDIEFDSAFFQKIFKKFEENPKLGIASGVCYVQQAKKLVEEKHPRFHTRGPLKVYRTECFRDIEGLDANEGWDTIDEIKAHMQGWTTRSCPDLKIIHLRKTQTANGALNGQKNIGRISYYTGYHPLYAVLRAARQAFTKPFFLSGIFMLWGYWEGYFKKDPRIADPAFIRYLRKQQINRLLRKDTIWK